MIFWFISEAGLSREIICINSDIFTNLAKLSQKEIGWQYSRKNFYYVLFAVKIGFYIESDCHIFPIFFKQKIQLLKFCVRWNQNQSLEKFVPRTLSYGGGRGLYSYIINSYPAKFLLKLFCEQHVKGGTCIYNRNYPFSIYNVCLKYNTVNHGYNEHAYNELTLAAKWFSYPLTL